MPSKKTEIKPEETSWICSACSRDPQKCEDCFHFDANNCSCPNCPHPH